MNTFWPNLFSSSRRAAPRDLQSLYDGAAKSWQDGIDKLGFDAAYRDLIQFAAPQTAASRHVLDAGCGTGALAEAYLHVTASAPALDLMDLSPDMLAQAQSRLPMASGFVGAVGETRLPKHYDVILCAHVIEHCPDPQAAVSWLFDQLRPGGRLILSVSRPHWCTALVRWRWGHQSYKHAQVTAFLDQAGFTDIRHMAFAKGPPSRLSYGYSATRPS